MYPNIMITNRLQPDSMITEADCATCDFNRPGKTCDRRLPWSWRGEYFPAKKDEYNMIRRTLQNETFPPRFPNQPPRAFSDLAMSEQNALVKKRLSDYSRKVYHKIKETTTTEREAIICQRENPFYADTVRDFRDRRYEYKNQQKVWKRNLEKVDRNDAFAREEAKKMVILYDSLQLAHKVILNSFYGYVMRKGSRWYSMEMAGVTCLTGATIIQMARALVEKIGRPLELDTDGIWCILPKSFPENYSFKLKDGKQIFMSYPCAMLNHLVHDKFTNNQYQTLVDPETFKYNVKSENSIFFEVDGPYRAMILPTSKEEDKNLKKRYAVFNDDGSLAELKGFEVKRRGELRLIKIFQSQIFKVFLDGTTLEECYASVAKVSNRWLDVLDSKGVTLADDELIDLICENRSMSRSLEDYGAQKSTSISTAKRLAEFLGDQMVKDKGLNCKYIISEKPRSAPVTERAIPVAIFSAEESIKSHFLRRWLKDTSLTEFDPRDLIDWEYYRERLASVIQKIITIPAALQKVTNPVPRVRHPDWLHKRLQRLEGGKQLSLDTFAVKPLEDVTNTAKKIGDLEDILSSGEVAAAAAVSKARGSLAKVTSKRKQRQANSNIDDTEALFASLPLVQPDINDDYEEWLAYMKKKWKIQRQARQRRQHLFGNSMISHRSNAGEVSSFLKNQAETRYGKEWQILQVAGSDVSGELKCWVMITGRIQCVTLKVNRKVYVDFKNDDYPDLQVHDMTVEKVNYTLPNGNNSSRLFRFTMKEDFYITENQKSNSIFTHHSVDGVYEASIDGVTRVVLDIGNSCQIDMTKKGVLGKGLESGFDVSSLIKCAPSADYLRALSFKVIFLYHMVTGDRQVFAIFSSFDERADVYIYESSTRQQQQFPNMENVYQAQYEQMKERNQIDNETFKVQESFKFNVDQSSSLKRMKRAVSARLIKLYSDSGSQALLALMSPRVRSIERDFSAVRDMPVLKFLPSQTDLALPPLGWQLPFARRLALHYLGLGRRIAEMMEVARYSNIPLGNLTPDDTRLVIDVQYARKLQEAGVILWWSPTPFPDRGGRQKDQSLLITENLEMPVVNNASSYEEVCIEISVKNLVINTVLTSALINEMEGTDNANMSVTGTGGAGESASVSFMENASSAPAIAVLRDLVKQWWEEALKQDKNADVMVNNFVRWVSSAESRLYDPVLQYHVRNLSRKAFLQLLAEFRRVGSQIVYARPDKLVVKTTKPAVSNAYAYAQYVVKSICAKPLFNFLDLQITRYWDYLLWMDDVNYGGFSCADVVDEAAQRYTLEMSWHIQSFLPEMLQAEFASWVQDFVELMHRAKIEELGAGYNLSSTPRPTQLRGTRADNDYFAKGTVLGLQKQLKKRVIHLIRRQTDADMDEKAVASAFAFPELPGSHLKATNATLELVKSLCAVFSLVREFNLEVRVVRRELLALFEVKEFSDQGIFKNPSTSLKLVQICNSCSLECELDFCRDETLMPSSSVSAAAELGEQEQRVHVPAWKCKHCAREFDRLAIEERMISEVMSFVTIYQTQDLRCGKCKQIKEDNLSDHCVCSGEWELTTSAQEIRSKLEVYRRVAEFYGLRMLDSLMHAIVI